MQDVETEVAMHKERNVNGWDAVVRNGAKEGDTASIDLFFFTKDKRAAEELRDMLQERFEYGVVLTSRGLFRKSYCVQAMTPPKPLSLATLNEVSEQMVRAGHEVGIEFDGWGVGIE